jgi:hypothetical protein
MCAPFNALSVIYNYRGNLILAHGQKIGYYDKTILPNQARISSPFKVRRSGNEKFFTIYVSLYT